MGNVETDFRISEELVTEVVDGVVAVDLAEFRREEVAHMQPGIEAFDLGAYASACREGKPEVADSLRTGLLIAHRTLRRANDDEPLPRDIDAELGSMAGKLIVGALLAHERLNNRCDEVVVAYAGSPGVPLLLGKILKQDGSRLGASMLLGFHARMADPSMRVNITIAANPYPAATGRRGF